jgi:hypothetical protein
MTAGPAADGSRGGRESDAAGVAGAGTGHCTPGEVGEMLAPAGPAAAEKGEEGSGDRDELVAGAEVYSGGPGRLDHSRDSVAGRYAGWPLVCAGGGASDNAELEAELAVQGVEADSASIRIWLAHSIAASTSSGDHGAVCGVLRKAPGGGWSEVGSN